MDYRIEATRSLGRGIESIPPHDQTETQRAIAFALLEHNELMQHQNELLRDLRDDLRAVLNTNNRCVDVNVLRRG